MRRAAEEQVAAYKGKELTLEHKWLLIPTFLKSDGIVKQHINSFNYFSEIELNELVTQTSLKQVTIDADPFFSLQFLKVRVMTPKVTSEGDSSVLTPMQCRQRDMTYAADVMADVKYYCGRNWRQAQVLIGRLPMMLKSKRCHLYNCTDEQLVAFKECPHDPGGYFIIKGNERVILMNEQLSKNRIILEKDSAGIIAASCVSVATENKTRTVVCHKDNKIWLKHNSLRGELVSLAVVFRAMGITNDQEFFQLCGGNKQPAYISCLKATLSDVRDLELDKQEETIAYIGKRVKPRPFPDKEEDASEHEKHLREGMNLLHNGVLPHAQPTIGTEFGPKIRFLSMMAQRCLAGVFGKSDYDDKDYYGNKRVELPGTMLAMLFEEHFRRYTDFLRKSINMRLQRWLASKGMLGQNTSQMEDYIDVKADGLLMHTAITNGLESAMSTGNFKIPRYRVDRTGACQLLNRLSYMVALGMTTRINSHFAKGVKTSGPRALQPSQWGMLCPCDTPEGESCGLVKNLTLLTHVTTDEAEDERVSRISFSLGVEDAMMIGSEELTDKGTFTVLLNGILIGVTRSPRRFLTRFKTVRRMGLIGPYASIYLNDDNRTILISSDGGRLCRPLYICRDGKPVVTPDILKKMVDGGMGFEDFQKEGIVEWLDVNEENNCLIALKVEDICKETTHLEVEAFGLMGVIAGLVPFPNHNQSPRNTYQCAMGKQAMGNMGWNQFNRYDGVMYMLVYPQRPLCQSRTIELVGWHKLAAGINCSVAVMSYSAYDIEDAIVMNRGAIDRGFGRCYVLKRFTTDLQNYPSGAIDCVFPPKSAAMDNSVSKRGKRRVDDRNEIGLDADGTARIGAMLASDNVIIRKHVPLNTNDPAGPRINPEHYHEYSLKYKIPMPATVDRVMITEKPGVGRIIKTIVRQLRPPELGDKFSSRHGQKGVVGCIIPPEDLPFNDRGWQPDLIMNPHGFPSRMTVGKMLELLSSKAAVMTGQWGYGTAFGGDKLEDIARKLHAHGFHANGKEELMSGITGEIAQCYIYAGPIYYQKLKHMVQDKIHARGRGPRTILTRQPLEGRAKQGGLRLGEMERDCLVAYGASNLLIERLKISSDETLVPICDTCGMIATPDYCSRCRISGTTHEVSLPYAYKLLTQEMMSMNVATRLKLRSVTP